MRTGSLTRPGGRPSTFWGVVTRCGQRLLEMLCGASDWYIYRNVRRYIGNTLDHAIGTHPSAVRDSCEGWPKTVGVPARPATVAQQRPFFLFWRATDLARESGRGSRHSGVNNLIPNMQVTRCGMLDMRLENLASMALQTQHSAGVNLHDTQGGKLSSVVRELVLR